MAVLMVKHATHLYIRCCSVIQMLIQMHFDSGKCILLVSHLAWQIDCLSHLWPLISWNLDSYVMHFEGDDMVAYSLPDGHSRTLEDHYALNFKTLEKDGVLLYSEGIQGDSVMLELKTGRLYLHMSLGKEWSKAACIWIKVLLCWTWFHCLILQEAVQSIT